MSATIAPTTPPGRPDLSAGGFVVSRAAEAERLAQFILSKKTHLVVLSGPPASGKTMLVSRWLMPALQEASRSRGATVSYAKCGRGIPEVFAGDDGTERLDVLLTRPSVIIADEFDEMFALSRDERRAQFDAFFAKLARAHDGAVVVAVVSEQYLTNIYALSSYDPAIVSSVCEIKPVGLADGLQQLASEDPSSGVRYGEDVLQRLRDESQALERRGIDVTFDLLKLLHERFRREAKETNVALIDAAQYDKIGGLLGVVRDHMSAWIDRLEAKRPGSDPLARAILQGVAETQARGAAADFGELAARFEVSDQTVQAVLADLTAPGGLLYQTAPEQYAFQPPQIAAVIEEELALRQLQNERALRIIEEGLRSRQQLGTFLPPARFAEIHRQRARLVLDDEMVRFMVQCALRDEVPGTESSEYWLRRVASRDDAMDVVLNAAFDNAPQVRERVAVLLGRFPEPIVRERLSVLALADVEPNVRAAAVESLRLMPDDALLDRWLQEVSKPKGAHRQAAISALRIFPRAKVAGVLQGLVRDPASDLELRTDAIDVLADLDIDESADALIDVALNDSDPEDRIAAAKALGRARTPAINRRILEQLSWRPPTLRIVIAASLLAIGLTAGTALAGISMIGLLLATRSGLGLILLGITIPTAILLRRMREGRVKWRTPIGFIALALYALCAITVLPIVHGLAHMMVKRYRRGLALLGLEAMGIFMYAVLSGATEFVPIPGLSFLALLYRVAGVGLFAGSYFYDVIATLFRTVMFRRAMTREERRAIIYHETFHNPVMADLVFADLRGAEPQKARRAKHLIRDYGGSVQPEKLLELLTESDTSYRPYVVRALREAKDDDAIAQLEKIAPTAHTTQQFAIAAVLGGNPTARSIDALRRVAARTGLFLQILAATATLRFRLGVWPWSARLAALCLVPAMGVLLYHGAMIRRNPAWSQIITLRQPLPSATQKAKIVNFLVDAYPRESAEPLRDLFREHKTHGVDSLHAALVRGLVVIQDSTTPDPEITAQLAAEAPKFDELLRRDSADFALGLDVLRTMAQSSDSALGKAATAALVRFVNADTSFAPDRFWRKQTIVRSLGNLPYTRGLPALDTLLRTRVSDKVQSKNPAAGSFTDVIREQIVQTARQAAASVAARNVASERASLLATLDRLDVSAPELTTLKREVQLANSGCDRRVTQCDGKDDALRVIAESPTSEDGYRDLYSHFTPATQFRQITDTFELLKARYPTSVWPRKILSELYHEVRSVNDTSAFGYAYAELSALRRLDAFTKMRTRSPENYVRIESDFVEVALSAEKYDEAETTARALLAKAPAPVDRLNLTLFAYMSDVLRRDRAAADSSLAALETVIRSLPASYYNNWVYPGTLVFIDRSKLPAAMKGALRDLCKEGQWYTPQEARRIIAENRAALAKGF